jgi:hypothetical protein
LATGEASATPATPSNGFQLKAKGNLVMNKVWVIGSPKIVTGKIKLAVGGDRNAAHEATE